MLKAAVCCSPSRPQGDNVFHARVASSAPCAWQHHPAFPLAWGLGQLLVLVGILTYFYFIIAIIPSAFFSPGGEISLCSCPALQTICSHLCHLCGEFWWQL